MKIVQINAVCGSGSTGKIAVDISRVLDENNIENYIFYSSGNAKEKNSFKYMTDFEVKLNALISKITGNYGFCSVLATRRLIKKIKELNPDIVHLHNIHGHNVNLEFLFNYLKSTDIKIVWTFHDCWALTGYCTCFDYVLCDKWKTKCGKCPLYKKSSWFFDKSSKLFHKKKQLFSETKNLTIVTPSDWLAEIVKQSFWGDASIEVINNGINLSMFFPNKNDFKEKYGISDKYMLLGVASPWSKQKGLDVFYKLSEILDDKFKIVLVGLSAKQLQTLPKNIIGIARTQNQTELAKVYSAADVFINPTYEDNFPTVNIESLACGTPVITFNTGGSPECIDETCGITVPKGDVSALEEAINSLSFKNFKREDCVVRASNNFDAKICFKKYLDLYNKVEKKQ